MSRTLNGEMLSALPDCDMTRRVDDQLFATGLRLVLPPNGEPASGCTTGAAPVPVMCANWRSFWDTPATVLLKLLSSSHMSGVDVSRLVAG